LAVVVQAAPDTALRNVPKAQQFGSFRAAGPAPTSSLHEL
jgi:hypothetical protein